MKKRPAGRLYKTIRIDEDIDRFILSRMRVQESYNEALHRIAEELASHDDVRREEDRREGRKAS